jgi:hypothetical protein
MSLPLNFSASDFVFASAPHLCFLEKKGYHTFHWSPEVLVLRTHFSAVL